VKALGELLVLVSVGLVIATSVNAVRTNGSLKWDKEYFVVKDAEPGIRTEAATLALPTDSRPDPPGSELAIATTSIEHPFQTITSEQIAEIVGDGEYDRGQYVFVDARNPKLFEAGHIPGAIRCYHYDLDICIDSVMLYAPSALQIIVYCNGGECEDSKYMCDELVNSRDIPYKMVYLYEGGWNEWSSKDMPFATGEN